MLLLGIDIGTSSIKVAVVDSATGKTLASEQYPDNLERSIKETQSGWAEQSPEQWWSDTKAALMKAHGTKKYNPKDIGAIGIAYQMHGLVCVDKQQNVLRDSIIWCDSRAVSYGNKAFESIGEEKCLSHLLNSPGNFTASKLAWVKENEPGIYQQIDRIMLPGDFIAMKLTGTVTTSISALSEGVFWDFASNSLSKDVMNYFGFEESIIPEIKDVFTEHGRLIKSIAEELNLQTNIPVSYKAGDQPNNALSLNVLEPGEVAATAGTSGVIYAVSNALTYDPQSRVNTFAHVNYRKEKIRTGVLLCINGTGIMNRWMKQVAGAGETYENLNKNAALIKTGSEGVRILPFGNGAERMLNNKVIGAHILNLDLNKHSAAHLYRAVQEGIAFSFRYGLDIMRENKMNPTVIRAGRANMFLSDVFTEAFVNATHVPIELYENDGSVGAALGAGIGAKMYKDPKEAFKDFHPQRLIEPRAGSEYDDVYFTWKKLLQNHLAQNG